MSLSENSSVGRAQPCQGWGRGFESRFSLFFALRSLDLRDFARMVELVYTQDLKSCGLWPCGFDPRSWYSFYLSYLPLINS